ncbi:SDR family oxidoreductase [Micromonospora sp. NBC_01655]|uniref:SDR family NAD(P)-dependent oxidoreductase n=1 Tax=Micromonospora sp. NBC_01655 TaxID=2975983 RepID=UPI00224E6B7B|nr:SDR family oxidoreductase [Micromonospora sp. NBC_01655]MCX4469603.1 SDR family oxidoreductase [Micromonospora sp. NBC_01655]
MTGVTRTVQPRSMRHVLVTGASRGIGRAVAVRFAEAGDRVAVHYLTRAADAQRTLQLLPGEGHALIQGDLSSPEECRRVVEEAERALGGLEIVVNNAAVATSPALRHPVVGTDFATWTDLWRLFTDINLLGAAHVSWAAAQSMLASNARGRIVNIGSRGAFRGELEHPAYAVTKAAMHALGQSLAIALAPHGIAVTSIAPGFTATERVVERFGSEIPAGITAGSPFGRIATPDEVAAAVLYLASPEAEWASGAVLDLNGASHLR